MTLLKKISVAGISASMLVASMLPAQAMPLAPAAPSVESPAIAVQYSRSSPRGDERWRDRPARRHHAGPRPSRHGGGWYRGHRGYRDHRPGYRYHDGYWFPLAAFAAGAAIAGAAASRPAPVDAGINPRHFEWCSDRYRSYDARSNTFQPYNGPRQQCYSPYY